MPYECLTFINAIVALRHHSHQIRIDVLVQHRSIAHYAALRVHVLIRILRCNFDNFLRIIHSAQIDAPCFDSLQSVANQLNVMTGQCASFRIRYIDIEVMCLVCDKKMNIEHA